MDVTETVHAPDRATWRNWLQQYHAQKKEIWLVTRAAHPNVSYLHAVEEALCFGWIDGLAKRLDEQRTAQRFTPRRKRSSWTELNTERARRLIAEGLMTDAGRAVLPDLDDAFEIAPDILAALRSDPATWANFQGFEKSYVRIRVGYVEEMRRRPDVFRARLSHFLKKTREGKQFGVTR